MNPVAESDKHYLDLNDCNLSRELLKLRVRNQKIVIVKMTPSINLLWINGRSLQIEDRRREMSNDELVEWHCQQKIVVIKISKVGKRLLYVLPWQGDLYH